MLTTTARANPRTTIAGIIFAIADFAGIIATIETGRVLPLLVGHGIAVGALLVALALAEDGGKDIIK